MKRLVLLMGMAFCLMQGHAQSSSRSRLHDAFEQYRKGVHEEFESFRQQCMAEFLKFASDPWREFQAEEPVKRPKEDEVPPVVIPEEDKKKPIEDRQVPIEEVVKPVTPAPQPKPVEPVIEVPVVEPKWVQFTFFNTDEKVRFDVANRPQLSSVSETAVVEALRHMTPEQYDNMLHDCLKIRQERRLCDWAYLQMLKALSEKVCGSGANEAALMLAYLYMQSGYQMRMAMTNGKLYMLFASPYQIYEKGSYTLDGQRYYGLEELPGRLQICQAAFPKEQVLSLDVTQEQVFAPNMSGTLERRSLNHPDVGCSLRVNKNLIAFYDSYPTSMIGGNFMTRWAMYANTPLQTEVKEELYPVLRKHLAGKNEQEAVSVLLDFAQMAFPYGYDDKVWGKDRAFFAEETLFYPLADCEDHAILFSRLVRDLVGLKVALVYYPGHLATAVHFSKPVQGDYLTISGERYTVCDPTYFGAPVGRTMPKMDNQTAKVIVLQN